jgi:hypothetical protein
LPRRKSLNRSTQKSGALARLGSPTRPKWALRIRGRLCSTATLVTNVADLPDDYFDTFDDVDPEEVEQVRLQFIAMDSTEELSQAFLGGDWWVLPALHDELRRACSGSGKLSRLLARRAGFEFIVGLAESLAYRGDGPLSTGLQFTSEFPEPKWNEEVIALNAPHRQDAVELSGYFSFMMH